MSEPITFDTEWARCSGWLEAALDHAGRTHTLEQVKAMVCDPAAETRFYAGAGSALVTVIERFPTGPVLQFWLAGGDDLGELVSHLRPMAEEWARENHGIRRFMLLGRRGWVGELADHGYRPEATLLVKELA